MRRLLVEANEEAPPNDSIAALKGSCCGVGRRDSEGEGKCACNIGGEVKEKNGSKKPRSRLEALFAGAPQLRGAALATAIKLHVNVEGGYGPT